MKEFDFDETVKSTVESCLDTLTVKGVEYRRNGNPFHNFDKGSEVTGRSREDVIWGMALKHFISVQDIKYDMKSGVLPTKEVLDEKYGDLINYLLIEKASILEKIHFKNKEHEKVSF